MATADLIIRLISDTSQLRGLDEAQGKFGRVGAGLRKMAVPAGVALAGVVAFGKGAIDAASRVEQAMGAVDSVFGKNAGQVKQWASDSATAVGLSKAAYAELATVMGSQLKNMGIPMGQVAGKTNDLIKLGADLAATYGGTTQEAVEALGSAFRGETDPIERYGVSIKEADVAAQMAKMGTDNLTGAAEKQARAMAILALTNKQTADAQGAFNREQGSAAQTAQVTAAQYENMQATLGKQLLPIVSALTAKLGQLATFMAKHSTLTKVAIGVVAGLAAGILVMNAALTVYTAVTTLAASATARAWLAALGPIGAVIAIVALLAFGIRKLWKTSETFRSIVRAVWNAVRTAALATWRAIVAGGRAAFSGLRSGFKAVQSAARAVWNAIKGIALPVWRAITSGARSMASALRSIWNAIKGAVRNVADAVKSFLRAAWKAAEGYVRGFVSTAKNVFQALRAAVGFVVDKVRNLVSAVRDIKVPGAIVDAFNRAKSAVTDVVNAVQNLISWIRNIPTPSINWPDPPNWLDKVMPGMVAPPAPGVARFAAPGVRTPGATSGSAGRQVNIVVNGALDPEATARQIQRILAGHNRRVGLRTA